MRASKFTEEQKVAALKLVEAGGSVDEVCRKLAITRTTFYRWKQQYGGMEASEARELKQLQDENKRLKKLVAEQALDVQMLKEVLSKKW